jgi:hypothetical protein
MPEKGKTSCRHRSGFTGLSNTNWWKRDTSDRIRRDTGNRGLRSYFDHAATGWRNSIIIFTNDVYIMEMINKTGAGIMCARTDRTGPTLSIFTG